MAETAKYKVFDAAGIYQAAVKEPEAGAVLVAFYGDGAEIRLGHRKSHVLWIEGASGAAAESYDACAARCLVREAEINREAYDRVHGERGGRND